MLLLDTQDDYGKFNFTINSSSSVYSCCVVWCVCVCVKFRVENSRLYSIKISNSVSLFIEEEGYASEGDFESER